MFTKKKTKANMVEYDAIYNCEKDSWGRLSVIDPSEQVVPKPMSVPRGGITMLNPNTQVIPVVNHNHQVGGAGGGGGAGAYHQYNTIIQGNSSGPSVGGPFNAAQQPVWDGGDSLHDLLEEVWAKIEPRIEAEVEKRCDVVIGALQDQITEMWELLREDEDE